MRFYVEKLQMEPKPLKLSYFGNCFRYDRPQKGRYREFKQAGCELIGTDTPEALAELIAMAYKILQNTGLKNIQLNIGNLNVLSAIFRKLKLPKEKQQYLTPLIDKSMYEDLLDALSDFGISPKDASTFLDILQTTDLDKILDFIKTDAKTKEEISKTKETLNFLKNSFGIKNYNVKMSIVRGLDYYKGIVFEIEAPNLGAEKQLCGGGAYDLVPLFGGRETPTSGFAIGFDRTILALETEKFKFPKQKIDAFVIPINEDMINKALEITEELRQNGVTVDIDLMRRGISKSLKYASSINAKTAVIVGPEELEKETVTIRDMEKGEQKTVKIKDVAKQF
jgi:histidyl-tRNA synthetase